MAGSMPPIPGMFPNLFPLNPGQVNISFPRWHCLYTYTHRHYNLTFVNLYAWGSWVRFLWCQSMQWHSRYIAIFFFLSLSDYILMSKVNPIWFCRLLGMHGVFMLVAFPLLLMNRLHILCFILCLFSIACFFFFFNNTLINSFLLWSNFDMVL